MRSILFSLIILSCIRVSAQRDRYRFAESYLGLEIEFIQESGSYNYSNNDNTVLESNLPSSISPRIVMGGTHFWGLADFYISIPVHNFMLNDSKRISISNEVLTGFRLNPLRIDQKGFSPYLGIGFNSKELQLSLERLDGPIYSNWQAYYEMGFSYRNKSNGLFEIGARYFPKSSYTNYINRSFNQELKLSPWSISLSYKKIVDFTKSYSTEGVKRYMKKIHEKAVKNDALDAWSFGIGLSALIPLEKTEFASRHAFFNDEIEGNLYPDLGVAYYKSNWDAAIRISFRPLKQEETAFGYTHQMKRNSFAFEGFKFIGDYHGFAPFIGPFASFDRVQIRETDFGSEVVKLKKNILGYGLIFGWDIRQTNVDYLILRTNLRYNPRLSLKKDGNFLVASQLEFNFIQLVFYPERYRLYKNKQ